MTLKSAPTGELPNDILLTLFRFFPPTLAPLGGAFFVDKLYIILYFLRADFVVNEASAF